MGRNITSEEDKPSNIHHVVIPGQEIWFLQAEMQALDIS